MNDFFHKTAAFTQTMYFFRIRWIGIRRNGRTPCSPHYTVTTLQSTWDSLTFPVRQAKIHWHT